MDEVFSRMAVGCKPLNCEEWDQKTGGNAGFLILSQVEMSGIEPESERFLPRISTSVAGFWFSPGDLEPARVSPSQPLGPESPSFARLAV